MSSVVDRKHSASEPDGHLSIPALYSAGRRGVRTVAEAVLPASVIVWRGPDARGRSLPARRSRIALTFDDGPTELTREYLSVLERFGARATFFVIGKLCEDHPELVAAIHGGGHELAGHGFTHRRFPTLSAPELREELFRTAALLPRPRGSARLIVRPPHGTISPSSVLTSARAGFTTALWSHDSGDWRTQEPREVLAAFDDEAAPKAGAIVLLHEGQAWTMDALPEILARLKEAGHELVTMAELLDG